ncbi:MAG: HI0074 family nucleotidyltransferase substrate-binding subunit [Chlamydiia bacterium]|nr:HI0074 family nucleotidyltransferase substrate-binding subunit [Chlamydiia bacterium]
MSQKDELSTQRFEASGRLLLAASQVEYALQTLGIAIRAPSQQNRLNIDATIQRFEYTIELFWKFLKHLLATQGVEVLSPKQALLEAYAMKLISDEATWINMQNDRSQTSHSYNIELADQIYSRIKIYHPLMHTTFQRIKAEFLRF